MTDGISLGMASVVSCSPDTIATEVDGELVALDIKRGHCYALNPTATHIWQMAARPVAVSRICDALVAEFEVDRSTCEADVLELLSGLRDEGLISVAPATSPPA